MNRKQRKLSRTHKEQALWKFERDRRSNILAKPGLNHFVIVLDSLKPDFNVGKIFRSADAFGAQEIHLIGIKHFDPAPASGSFKWVPAKFHDNFQSCYDHLLENNYQLYALEPGLDNLLTDTKLPEKSAFIFGHEEFGLSFNTTDFKEIKTLSIPQSGKVQSLNVSVAASIVMYEYVRQYPNNSASQDI